MNAVLIVEDEKHLADGLRFNLEAEGFSVDIAIDAESAEDLLLKKRKPYDVVVLDVMLPGKNGFALASSLRKAEQFVPILMLTARGEAQDVLRGFEAGADDYLPKPFELSVLIARLNALLRRREWLRNTRTVATANEHPATPPEKQPKLFEFDGKTIDFDALELRSGNHTVRLTVMEAELLRYLIKHDGRIVSRRSILEDVWGLREDTDTRAIDNFIVRLRKYIEDEPSQPKHLTTVRGVGYKFISKARAKTKPSGGVDV
ncbi:MAG TPA: response regulator transcription factor [Pyrinomonadaceae bacterium]|nr:response regulator transcription factor [Pyrinomonadaceae bacterium]